MGWDNAAQVPAGGGGPMSRSYKNVFPKKFWVYSVEELVSLYSVNANTVSNWVGDGLTPSDGLKPYLFQGAEMQRFHMERRVRASTKLRPGQFFCFTCKARGFPDIETMTDNEQINGNHRFAALCPDCSASVSKISNEADRAFIEDCRNPNTSRHCLHEEDRLIPSGIGISGGCSSDSFHTHNDRIIHNWLTYAGRYHVKTIDRHLAAIRYSEAILAGKPFSKLTRDDVAKVRNDLKRRATAGVADRLSSSSIRHIVSHLTAFFNWLLKQEGLKSLPQDLEGYLKLPQAVLASAAQVSRKDYPTLGEAELLLGAMPSRALVDQRARAIFALAFLGALRADTLISLRIKNVDISRRLILQDGGTVRAKAGKSIDILWFPIPKCFEAAVIEWIHALKSLGYTGEDALFPDNINLKHKPRTQGENHKSVPVMSTIHAVTQSFSIACRQNAVNFTPHSAKHCIGAERDERPLTQIERKAWSENMGHENEQITERHYGKLPDERRFEVLESIGANPVGEPLKFSEQEIFALGNMVVEFIRSR